MAFCLIGRVFLGETITRLVDSGNTTNAVYLDFAKVFDSVNHRFLLAKVESFGLCENVVR